MISPLALSNSVPLFARDSDRPSDLRSETQSCPSWPRTETDGQLWFCSGLSALIETFYLSLFFLWGKYLFRVSVTCGSYFRTDRNSAR